MSLVSFLGQLGNNAASSASQGAVGGFLGRVFGLSKSERQQNQFNADQAAIAREFSSSEAQKSRDWMQSMSNTAYQRQVADMRSAGLNPQFMYGQGVSGGASTPSGPVAQSQSASGHGGSSVAEMMQQATMAAQLRLIDSQVRKNNAEAGVSEVTSENMPKVWESQIKQALSTASNQYEQANLNAINSAYKAIEVGVAKDLFNAQIANLRSAASLNDAQKRGVVASTGLTLLKQITETKNWDNLDASTKEMLSKADVNAAQLPLISAEISELYSRCGLQAAQTTVLNSQQGLLAAEAALREIEVFMKDPEQFGKFGSKVYRVLNTTIDEVSKLFHVGIGLNWSNSKTESHAKTESTTVSSSVSNVFSDVTTHHGYDKY